MPQKGRSRMQCLSTKQPPRAQPLLLHPSSHPLGQERMGITQPTRIELLRLVPLLLVVVHRPEVDDDPGALGDGVFPNAAKWTQSEAVAPSPQSLPMTWMCPKGVSPGVSKGHMWDEQGGHGPDAQHFTDGGFQVGQQWAVAEVGVTYQANLVVHFLLDLPLDLGAKQRPVWEPREQGALSTVEYTQHHQHVLSSCVGQKCPQPDPAYMQSLTSLLAPAFPKTPHDIPGAGGNPSPRCRVQTLPQGSGAGRARPI